MATPIYQLKAEFFKTLGHPARVRILELLAEGPKTVSILGEEVGLEPSHLSQQLSVLRRFGLIVPSKQGSAVTYSLAQDEVIDLLAVSRHIISGLLSGAADLLKDLKAADHD